MVEKIGPFVLPVESIIVGDCQSRTFQVCDDNGRERYIGISSNDSSLTYPFAVSVGMLNKEGNLEVVGGGSGRTVRDALVAATDLSSANLVLKFFSSHKY